VLAATTLVDKVSGKRTVVAEVAAYGDVVLRLVSGDFEGPFLPNYKPVDSPVHSYGLQRMDHCVGNVPTLFEATDYLSKVTGAYSTPAGYLLGHQASVLSRAQHCILRLIAEHNRRIIR
jgi:hypothetical protein